MACRWCGSFEHESFNCPYPDSIVEESDAEEEPKEENDLNKEIEEWY